MTKKFKIGIDYGGTKIEGILLDPNGEKLERKRYSYDKIIHQVFQLFKN